MRKYLICIVCLACNISLFAQDKMYIHKSDFITVGALIAKTDSVTFSNDSISYFHIGDTIAEYPTSKIDSISFGNSTDTISIRFRGSVVTVLNPLAFEGVTVTVKGTDVTIRSTTALRDVNYRFSGNCSNGSVKIYSEKRFNILLHGLKLTNLIGPAINIQSNNKATIELEENYDNVLKDSIPYYSSTEDQKGTLFSEGQLVFKGKGYLSVSSFAKHGICSDDYVSIEGGNITVVSAAKDGIHATNYFKMTDGNATVNSADDGIAVEKGYVDVEGGTLTVNSTSDDTRAVSSDSILTITGGTLNLNVTGKQSKGLKSSKNMTLNGGVINVKASGDAVLQISGSGFNPAYCAAVKCDSNLTINGSEINITCSGLGTKGISCDSNVLINSGKITISTTGNGATYKNSTGTTDSYSSACITTDGDLNIIGGELTLSSSGTAGKGLKVGGALTVGSTDIIPTINITTTGTKIAASTTTTTTTVGGPGGGGFPGGGGQSSGTYDQAKAIKSIGAITVNNGVVTISSADDGMKSDKSITINNGTVTILNSIEAMESVLITVNKGTVKIAASNDGFNATASTVSGGTESDDGSCLTINGGYVVTTCSNGDAIDSNGKVVMTGGTLIANGPSSGVEEAADFNGTFTMKGGFFVGAGSNSNMTKALSTSSTQNNLYISSSALISTSTFIHIQDAAGTDVLTFKPLNGAYKFLFSSLALTAGVTYSIYTGGSYEGGNSSDGVYTGGSYTGGTLKKSFTLSNTGTVTTISF